MAVVAQDGARWARITPDDRSGILYIIALISFTYTSLTFFARVSIKWRMLGLDDGAILVAQITSIVQFALMLASLSAGLGKSFDAITNDQYARMASTYSGGQVAIYIALGFSKISAILLVRRLFMSDMKNAWMTCNTITAAIVIWTLVSAVLVSAGCSEHSLSPKTPMDICPGIEVRYLFITVTDAITDLLLAFVPTYLCRHLQMDIVFKLQVLGIFSLRLPLIALAALFFRAWKTSLHSANPGTARTNALAFQQAQLCFSLISATIPCLKSFLRSFDTGSGAKADFVSHSNSGAYGHRSTVHHGSTQTTNGEGYEMSSFDRSHNSGAGVRKEKDRKAAVRVNKKASTDGGLADGVELERRHTLDTDQRSQESTQELFIKKDVQWDVRREPAGRWRDSYQPGQLYLPK